MWLSKAVVKLVGDHARFSSMSTYLFVNNASPFIQEEPHPRRTDIFPASKPSFDIKKVVVEPGNLSNAGEFRSFLYSHYFRHHPTIAGLVKGRDSPLLASLAQRYTTADDQWLAYQIEPKMRKRYLVGAIVAFKKYPWEVRRLEQWASRIPKPDSYHLYFCAHCVRSADIFTKYRIPYAYDIELLASATEVSGYGVEDLLLRTALLSVLKSNHYPLVQILSTNRFVSEASERAGMMLEWSMNLSEFGDEDGKALFCSDNHYRTAHATTNLFIRLFSPRRDTIPYHPKPIAKGKVFDY